MNHMNVSATQIQDTMARMGCFDGWDKDQLLSLAVGAKQIILAKGDRLIGKGDRIHALYVVVSGQVRLFIPLPNNAERVISLLSRGESFGEPCLINAAPCPYEVVASKDSHLIAIDALVYRRQLRDSPILAQRTLQLLSHRLLQTLKDIEICAQPSGLQRVARYMLQLQPPTEACNEDIRLPALKRDIAAKLGLTQETFSRMLAFMAQQGFIHMRGSQIGVEDWERLQALATDGCPIETGRKN